MITTSRFFGAIAWAFACRGPRASMAGRTSVVAPAAIMNFRRENSTITRCLLGALHVDAVAERIARGDPEQQIAKVLTRAFESRLQLVQHASVGRFFGVPRGEAKPLEHDTILYLGQLGELAAELLGRRDRGVDGRRHRELAPPIDRLALIGVAVPPDFIVKLERHRQRIHQGVTPGARRLRAMRFESLAGGHLRSDLGNGDHQVVRGIRWRRAEKLLADELAASDWRALVGVSKDREDRGHRENAVAEWNGLDAREPATRGSLNPVEGRELCIEKRMLPGQQRGQRIAASKDVSNEEIGLLQERALKRRVPRGRDRVRL